MMGRRSAALLCVLLAHALIIFLLNRMRPPVPRLAVEGLPTRPIHLDLAPKPVPDPSQPGPVTFEPVPSPTPAEPNAPADAFAAADEAASSPPTGVDWPIEARRAVKRVLDAEEAAERVARMFSGPKGTWASLTPRDRSAVKQFKWKPGVVPERDENGNTIVHISDGCVLVNFSFLACAIGKKPPAYGDLFKDMRLYFDEQRMPESKNGNGR